MIGRMTGRKKWSPSHIVTRICILGLPCGPAVTPCAPRRQWNASSETHRGSGQPSSTDDCFAPRSRERERREGERGKRRERLERGRDSKERERERIPPGGTPLLFVTAVPNTKLFARGEGDSGGHAMRYDEPRLVRTSLVCLVVVYYCSS